MTVGRHVFINTFFARSYTVSGVQDKRTAEIRCTYNIRHYQLA
jgi:hypothetical protein